MSGVLAKFRSPGIRPTNHRWAEADRIVTENYGRHLLSSKESKRAFWHPDKHVRTLIRLKASTNKLSWTPEDADLQPGDEDYLCAIDLMTEDTTRRQRHTVECLLIGGASDEEAAEVANVSPEVIRLCHDIFYDVRDRLDKPLVIQDLCLPPAIMQGGVKDPGTVERIISYLAGWRLLVLARIGKVSDDNVRHIFEQLREGLMGNQGVSALFRRSLGYDSTEGAIEHMQQHILITARAAAAVDSRGDEDPRSKRVRRGVQDLISHTLKPQVVCEGDETFTAMKQESATMGADHVQEVIK